MITRRILLSQAVASMAMLSAGTLYLFSLYGSRLSSLLSFSQTQTAFVAATGNAGVFVMGPLFGGLLVNYSKYSELFFGTGGILIGSGYYLVSLIVKEAESSKEKYSANYMLLALLFFVIGTGSSSTYHASLSINYKNWPKHLQSTAIGLSVSFFGLSAYLYALAGSLWFLDLDGRLKLVPYLQFLAWTSFSINLLAMLFLKPISNLEGETGLLNTPLNLEEEQVPLLNEGGYIEDDDFDEYQEEAEERTSLSQSVIPNLSPNPLHTPVRQSSLHQSLSPLMTPQSTAIETGGIYIDEIPFFSNFDAHLLAFILFTITGTGLMYINNVGTVILSILPQSTPHSIITTIQSNHVSLISICSFVSRMAFGLLADFLQHYGIKKSAWAIVVCCFMLAGNTIILKGCGINELYIVTICVAVAYGGIWTITPILIGQYFGQNSFSRNWGWMTVIPALGGHIFSAVFGRVYDNAGDGHPCFGKECFEAAFDGAWILTGFSILVSLYLFIKIKTE